MCIYIFNYEKIAYVIIEAESAQDMQSTSHMPRRASDVVPNSL